jgi:hypothetical protein
MDRVRVASTFLRARRAARLCRGKREHGAKDERILGQEVPVNTKKAALDLYQKERKKKKRQFNENWRAYRRLTDLEHRHFVCKVKFAMSGYNGIVVLARANALNFFYGHKSLSP